MRQERADELLDVLLEEGVNHLDVAASYGDAELRVAPWLAAHPGRFFVATKTGERDGDGARASLERSLERLGVDSVDLIQMHNLVEEDEWTQAFAPGGALDALCRARDEGLCRHIGVTGHGLRVAGMHLRSLERFDFDSVLLPCSHVLLADPGYRADFTAVVERCAERRVGVQTIKSVARRRWPDDVTGPRFAWYEPLPPGALAAVGRAVRFVLSQPTLFLNSSSDARLLRPVLEAAASPGATGAPDPADLDADVAALAMTPIFDGGALEAI
jgi:aryl-alcohol dehydrogenase-like predicted oxidoreductase